MQATFSSGSIGIRRYRKDDVDALFTAVRESVRELSVWMPWCSESYSRAESEAFVQSREAEWERGEQYSFVIYDATTGHFLGGVGLNFINRIHQFANLGYWVHTAHTRRGVATTAARLAAGFGLGELGFNRLEIVAAAGHVASQRVARKVGAHCEGVLRKRLVIHGKTHDAVMFSLVVEDLK
ncbi:MAG TPA: GNAT family N-acetyltransferase [Verrucomicrobiae bacterium]|nr:GNAT family N-acetyltransferase [Verrucomicrobiae bacterium]